MLDSPAHARDRILGILEAGRDMTLASLREDGFPQATKVGYVNDGLSLCFLADPVKARSLARTDKVSATVDLPAEWRHIRGLSLAGHARRITDGGTCAALTRRLLRRFPEAATDAETGLGRLSLFRIEPERIAMLEEWPGLGHAELFEI